MPYLEVTGNAVAYNQVDLEARVQGYLQEINYQDGAAGQAGRHAVRHRAGAVSGATAAGAGHAGRHPGRPGSGGGRVHPAVHPGQERLRLAVEGRRGPRQARFRQGPDPEQSGRHHDRRDQSRLHAGSPRRSTAWSPRIWYRSAVWSASPGRPSSPPSCSSIRSTSPSRSASSRCCGSRRRWPKRGLKPGEIKNVPVEVGLMTEDGLSARRQARLRRADARSVDRHADRARHIREPEPRPAARHVPAHPRAAGAGEGERAAGARRGARRRPERQLSAGRRQGQRRAAATVRPANWRASCA